ncbi:family 78 glycoside hydrolase catalytic domain [Butyrivibrio sp. MC2013]|uniref:family 78 glycoside hydrolase catalytic domain n=1 Tax=Butyrivibrio sp. MC2013 TaxID=1280686 RepID=UPI000406E2DA|nr:family 78 glycoside hydrolase catalytic domain [Butyrivibrio sp. MC2013]
MKKEIIGKICLGMGVVLICTSLSGCRRGDEEAGPLGNSSGTNEETNTESGAPITDLTVCYMTDPIGIDEMPTFSWRYAKGSKVRRQEAYRIEVREESSKDAVWDSGWVESDDSLCIAYDGDELSPCTRYAYSVTIRDDEGRELSSSGDSYFETGVLDWNSYWPDAEWIYKDVSDSADKSYNTDDLKNGKDVYADMEQGSESHDGTRPTDFTASFSLEGEGVISGIILGDMDDLYDRGFVILIDDTGEEAAIIFQSAENGELQSDVKVTCPIAKGADYEVSVDAGADSLSFTVNGKKESLSPDEYKAVGTILPFDITKAGLYKDRVDKKAYIDDLRLEAGSDCKKYYSFDEKNVAAEGEDSFAPQYLTIKDGKALIPAGITLAGGNLDPAPIFRREFGTADKDIASVRLYASALGIMDISINGEPVTENIFDPGACSYDEYVNYMSYDVTDLVKRGADNAISCVLGHGWYDRSGAKWGDQIAFIGGLEIRYADGSRERLVTDSSWKCSEGPVRFDDFYQGEIYDAGYEKGIRGWQESGFDDSSWEAAALLNGCISELTSSPRAPVRVIEERKPVSVTKPYEDTLLLDFGSQLSGRLKINAGGSQGDLITVRYGEILNSNMLSCADDEPGTIYTANLLRAADTDYYIFGEDKECTYEPTLTWRSFRYAQISGISADDMDRDDLAVAVSISSAHKRVYSFDSGSDILNRLVEAMHVSGVCNSVDHPSDCPQRDERFAWTGDYNFYAPTGVYQEDQSLIMRHFMKGMVSAQGADGAYQDIAFIPGSGIGNPGWGDAGVTIPYLLYKYYGDDITCSRYYDSMASYGEYLLGRSENYIYPAEMGEYGDLSALNDVPADLVHTASCIRVMHYLAEIGRAIGRDNDAEHYAECEARYIEAFRDRFIDENGIIASWTQSSYCLPLGLHIYPAELEDKGYSYLHTCAEAAAYSQTTGYAASGYLLPALAEGGYVDDAYRVLLSTADNSWGGLLDKYDLTALPERLGAIRTYEDGSYSINGSLNHESGGSIGRFVYQYILGMDIDAASRQITICPYPGRQLGYAEGSYDSILGRIEVRWEYTNAEDGSEAIRYNIHIPEGSAAHLILRDAAGNVCLDEETGYGDHEYVF